jgi:hypothetical protein
MIVLKRLYNYTSAVLAPFLLRIIGMDAMVTPREVPYLNK